tara:strand:- start:1373 stop:1540 length:168 start_codon:yes stop_codon:yes gene_type:complete
LFELRLKVIENGDTDVLVLKDGRSVVLECRAIEAEERDDGLHIYPGEWEEIEIAQ